MLLSFLALKKRLPALNEREFTEADFFKIIKLGRVYYCETPLDRDVSGFYLADETGGEYIVINSILRGAEKLRSQFHEISHHLLDCPIDDEIILLFRSMETLRRRADITAEAMSLLFIFPFRTLERYLLKNELPEYLQPYLQERLRILNDHGI